MLRIYLERKDYADETVLHLIDEREDGRRFHAKTIDLVFQEREGGEFIEPFLKTSGRIGREFLQSLAAALAESGYRVDTSTERGELAATKRHLEREIEINDRLMLKAR